MQIVKRLGTNIRAFRKAKGFTQAEMAEYCDLSTRGYQEIESGNIGTVRESTVNKLIKATGLTESELFGTSESQLVQSRDQLLVELFQKSSMINNTEMIQDLIDQADSFLDVENKRRKESV
ncbi:MAG: hypothetical protein CME63_01635 [Halobacteriovoraceae bacterium]|nr:hypothetical protein [Halobacteriovoraceae bacterium]|tara:strand:- start:6529 stop:6891 length:363 start_codon:yes stop_codon:yes gene_type:complete